MHRLARLVPLLVGVLLLSALPGRAQTVQPTPELGPCFADAHVDGTFVLLDSGTNTLRVWNELRARQRFIPASTFKIANSLIALNTGAVKSVDETLPYGGKPQPIKAWEHDMPMREAIKLSAVPIYQEVARRVGLERMAAGVRALGYGNAEIGAVVDRFWLDGPLRISAVEQTDFLRRLVEGKLPVSASAAAAVEEITLQESTNRYELHYKTGWGDDEQAQVAWVVGWLTTTGKTSTFALNFAPTSDADFPKRVPLLKACLTTLGVLPYSDPQPN